jgi:hypothetical protein
MEFQTWLKRSNGWQRLWLVASALWVIVVLWYAIPEFATEARWMETARQRAYARQGEFQRGNEQTYRTCLSLNAKLGDDMQSECSSYSPDKQHFKEQIQFVYDNEIRSAQESVSRDLIGTQLIELVAYAGVWAISSIALYALGLLIAWIRRGFRNSKPVNVD